MYYLFKSTRDVIKAEGFVKNHGIKYRIIPVPKNISSECGMAIETEMTEETDRCLNESGIGYQKHDNGAKKV